jgi:3-deoxy-7-phosphoheptulonate synthase
MTETKAYQTSNVRVTRLERIDSPEVVKQEIPISGTTAKLILGHRQAICSAIGGKDPRLLVVVGPCSIHDEKAALEYAERLAKLRDRVQNKLIVVMRVYFEKPRTTVGWKGLINDPKLDNSQDINLGLRQARGIMAKINALGVPCATEFLDPIVPQYISDLVSWVAIGARTTESQTHREMASGLSMPVGFKNATDGDLQVALDAMISSRNAHSFLGIDQQGHSAVVRTTGNPDVHIVLRGGSSGPNFSAAHVAFTKVTLNEPQRRLILVDCSHGNSNKDYRRQPEVFRNLLAQHRAGEQAILGMMLESHLNDGQQKILSNPGTLQYGVSVTDGCIGWETTEKLLLESLD